MFICQISGKLSQPREKSYRLVTKTRHKEYFEDPINKKNKIGEGLEIVEEKIVCKEIYEQLKGRQNEN